MIANGSSKCTADLSYKDAVKEWHERVVDGQDSNIQPEATRKRRNSKKT